MGFADAVKALYSNYAKFDGRASRSEYWWAFLYFMMLYVVMLSATTVLGNLTGTLVSFVISLVIIGSFIPMISVAVRRLHDYDKSGWLYLVSLIPIAGLYTLYLYVQPGTRGPNRFGPDPLDGHTSGHQPPGFQKVGTPTKGSHTRIFM